MMSKFTKIFKANTTTAKDHLQWLIYQVCNGGVIQYCINGYADELLDYIETHDIIKELQEMGCPEQGVQAMSKIIDLLKRHTPTAECIECGGRGEWENEDENGDIEDIVCDYCDGDGFVRVDGWVNADNQYWMEEYENWLYALNTDELDDWTNQSHNHSVFMDMIQQNKE